tara:strand:+ start:585 stop:1085 length:501 start_codon:yes stop_codon:yes gene_type:complete
MKYASIRTSIVTGDVAMVEGFGIVSKAIRVLTGEKISHIAMFIWLGDGLFIAEFKEFHGFRLMPASIWLKDTISSGNNVFYGQAPHVVRSKASDIARLAFKWRNKPYGYFSLLKIWWSKITKRPISVRKVACSTYVKDMWFSYSFPVTPAPGNFMEYVNYSSLLVE